MTPSDNVVLSYLPKPCSSFANTNAPTDAGTVIQFFVWLVERQVCCAGYTDRAPGKTRGGYLRGGGSLQRSDHQPEPTWGCVGKGNGWTAGRTAVPTVPAGEADGSELGLAPIRAAARQSRPSSRWPSTGSLTGAQRVGLD